MVKHRNSLKTILYTRDRYKLIVFGVIVGICVGLIAVAYRFTLSYAEELRRNIFSSVSSAWSIVVLFASLALFGLVVGKITEKEPLIKGSGIPQLEGQLMGYFSPSWLPVLLKKFITGALSILAGLSLGREGPSIQLGAMTAQGICERFNCSNMERKYLLVCGASAGLAAAFNAPLAGVMFALEEVHKNFSARAVFPAMVSAITADIIAKQFFGTVSIFRLDVTPQLPIKFYFLYVLIGLVMGVLGSIYNRVLIGTQKLYAYSRLPVWACIIIPFMLAGVLGFFLPEVLGSGHNIIEGLASGEYLLAFMVLLLLAKFAFSMISFGSGAPGGIFFPLLVLGALAGCIFAKLSVFGFGLPESYIMNFMLLGMTGMFAAIVRAPLTGIILIMEISGSLTHFAGLSIVACIACLTASLLRSRPIYEQLLDNMTPDSIDSSKSSNEQNILDIAVPYSSYLAGKAVSEIAWPQSCLIVNITRGNYQIIPHGDTHIEAGDVISIVCPVGEEALVQKAVGSAVSG